MWGKKRIQIVLIAACFVAGSYAAVSAEKAPSRKKVEGADYCVSCHKRQQDAKLSRPVAEWRNSVHDGPNIKCSLCHGGDPSADDKLLAKSKQANFTGKPDRKKVSEFCGRETCHIKALNQFKRGPHYLSAQKTGQPACTSCHGVHNIKRSSVDIINVKTCTACHSAKYSQDIIAVISGIDRGINAIDGNVQYLLDRHAEVKNLQSRLAGVRHLFHQFVHVFSQDEMETTRTILNMEISSLDVETRSKVSGIQRMDLLYVSVVALGLAIILGIFIYVIVMYNKRKR